MENYLKLRFVLRCIWVLIFNYLVLAGVLLISALVLGDAVGIWDIMSLLLWIKIAPWGGVIILIINELWVLRALINQYKNEKMIVETIEEYLVGEYSYTDMLEFVVRGNCRKTFIALLKKRGYNAYKSVAEKYRLNKLRYLFEIKPCKKTNPLFLEYVYDNYILAVNNDRVKKDSRWSSEQKLSEEEIKYGIQKEWLVLSKDHCILGKVGFYDLMDVEESDSLVDVYLDMNEKVIRQNGIDMEDLLNVILFHLKEVGRKELNLGMLWVDNIVRYEKVYKSNGYSNMHNNSVYVFNEDLLKG